MIFEMMTIDLVVKLMMTCSLLSFVFVTFGVMIAAKNDLNGVELASPFCKRSVALSFVFMILALLLAIIFFWMH